MESFRESARNRMNGPNTTHEKEEEKREREKYNVEGGGGCRVHLKQSEEKTGIELEEYKEDSELTSS